MSWFSRLKNAIRPAALDRELADEMKDHLERRAASLRKKGLSADEAARQAALRFGNVMLRREESRDIRSWAVLDSVLQDARYGWRMMLKNSALTATAVLSLTLAIGANTAIFSIVDAAMLRPLPLPQPERLFTLVSPDFEQPGTEVLRERETFNYPLYLQFRSAAGSSAHLALFSIPVRREARISGAAAPLEHVMTQFVSGEAFLILGVRPALGRLFSAEEDRTPGGYPFAVLSYEFWHRRFGADPAILGRTIHLGGELGGKGYFVVGVARYGFFGIEPGKFVDIWLPAMMYEREAFTNPGWSWFRIMGRLAPSCAREQLQARLQPAFHEHQEEMMKRFPTIPSAVRRQFLEMAIRVASGAGGPSDFRRTFARPLWIVLGVAGAILLIACANVASLLLARSTARSAEMSMRIALGASRNRLVRQLLTESLMLSALAGGLGWLTARAAAPALVNLLSKQSDPVRLALAMDSRMLLFCIGASAITAICFGLLPAWRASGVQPLVALRFTSGGAGKLRAGRFSVAIQVAFSFCLVITASAFLFSLRNLMLVDTGFDRRNVAVLSIATEWKGKSQGLQRALMDELQRRVRALTGVQSVALAPWPIFEGGGWSDRVILAGRGPSEREEIFYRISPGYFKTLRTPLLDGRDFQLLDSTAPQPIPTIINLAFARKYFGSDQAVDKEFQRPQGKELIRHRVIGVAANAHYGELRKGAEPIAYVPLEGDSGFTLYVRSPLNVGSLVRVIEREGQALGPLRVQEITTLESLVGNTILREKLLAGISGLFAFLGLLLASVGMFGLLSYSVTRRTKEIGIRTAMGAQKYDIVFLIVKELGTVFVGGLLAGLAGSLVMMVIFQSLLFGIRPSDPLVIGAAAMVFLVASSLAAGLPARRAAGVDPLVALRYE